MSETHPDEPGVVMAFLQRFLEDRAQGRAVPLHAYLAAYPGYETAIAREFARVAGHQGDASDPSESTSHASTSDALLTLRDADALARTLTRKGDGTWARYQVEEEIGRGGMGIVLKVRDTELCRTLAMKVLTRMPGQRDATRAWARFFEEAQLTSQLQHPGIVPVHEVGFDAEGRPFFTMPLIRGRNFREIIELVDLGRDGWTLARAVDVILRVCDAVAFAHSRGVLHRDLKPANIMVGAFGEVHVMDWGLARLAIGAAAGNHASDTDPDSDKDPDQEPQARTNRAPSRSDPAALAVTRDGDVLGTPAYMAPEQARGATEAIGPATDVYGIGATLYHLVAGQRPYAGRDDAAQSSAGRLPVLDGPPDSIASLRNDRPAELIAIVEKAMQREPEQRYPSVRALARDLRAFREVRVVTAYESGAWAGLRKWLARNRGLAAMGAAAVIALIAGTIVSLVLASRAESHAQRWHNEHRAGLVERGRLLGRTGSLDDAEDLLWREYLTSESTHAFWALCELYRRRPCLAARQAPGRLLATILGPADRWTATAGDRAEIHLYDGRDLRPIGVLPRVHTSAIHALACDAAGRLASAGAGGLIVLWDVEERRAVRTRALASSVEPLHGVFACTFSPDGALLAAGDQCGRVHLLDPESLATRQCFDYAGDAPPEARAVHALQFSPDGSSLAWAGADGVVRVRALTTGAVVELVDAAEDPEEARIDCLAFGLDGRTLYSGCADRNLRVWDLARRELRHRVALQGGTVRHIEIGRDGKSLAIGCSWHTELRDAETLTVQQRFPVLSTIQSSFTRDGKRLLIGSRSGVVRLWEISSEPGVVRLCGHSGRVAVTASSDGRIATGDSEGKVRIFSSAGACTAVLDAHRMRVRSLDFSPSGRLLASGGRDGVVHVWDPAPGRIEPRRTIEGHDDHTRSSVRFLDERRLAHTANTEFQVIDVDTGEITLRIPSAKQALAIESCRGAIVTTARDQHLRTWSARGAPIRAIHITHTGWSIAVSDDESRIANGNWSQAIGVFDGTTHDLVAELTGHAGLVSDVAFRPGSSRVLASVSVDRTVRLWEITDRRCLLTLEPFASDVLGVAWSPDGKKLIVSGEHPDVIIWDLEWFERRVAGNLDRQVERFQGELGGSMHAGRLTAWADGVLSGEVVEHRSR